MTEREGGKYFYTQWRERPTTFLKIEKTPVKNILRGKTKGRTHAGGEKKKESIKRRRGELVILRGRLPL